MTNQTADPLRRYRDWLAAQLAKAEAADQAGEVPPDLRISPHNGIASGLRTALWGLDQITNSHNTGPTIREAAADDRRWWDIEKEGA